MVDLSPPRWTARPTGGGWTTFSGRVGAVGPAATGHAARGPTDLRRAAGCLPRMAEFPQADGADPGRGRPHPALRGVVGPLSAAGSAGLARTGAAAHAGQPGTPLRLGADGGSASRCR